MGTPPILSKTQTRMDTQFLMEITMAMTSDREIDIRDRSGIRIMLLTRENNPGLYQYFELRMKQFKGNADY